MLLLLLPVMYRTLLFQCMKKHLIIPDMRDKTCLTSIQIDSVYVRAFLLNNYDSYVQLI